MKKITFVMFEWMPSNLASSILYTLTLKLRSGGRLILKDKKKNKNNPFHCNARFQMPFSNYFVLKCHANDILRTKASGNGHYHEFVHVFFLAILHSPTI